MSPPTIFAFFGTMIRVSGEALSKIAPRAANDYRDVATAFGTGSSAVRVWHIFTNRDKEIILAGQQKIANQIIEGQQKIASQIIEGQQKIASQIIEGQQKTASQIIQAQQESTKQITQAQQESTKQITQAQQESTKQITQAQQECADRIIQAQQECSQRILDNQREGIEAQRFQMEVLAMQLSKVSTIAPSNAP